MRKSVLFFQLICLIASVCFPAACLSKKQVASSVSKPTIRYGENGVPNIIKGDNLSVALDSDPVFQKLKEKNRYNEIVLRYMESQRDLFKFSSARDEFVVKDVKTDTLGQTHIKLQQVCKQIPVWGKNSIVHLNQANEVYYFHGNYQPISTDIVTDAVISEETAGQTALGAKPNPEQWQVEAVDAWIWAPDNAVQRLAFKATLLKKDFYREECFVDAVDKRILHCISATMEKGTSGKLNLVHD